MNHGFDANTMIGHWPFRKLRKNSMESILDVHCQNEIQGGFISSLDAVFYNDPYEADADLSKIVDGTSYRHIQSINPHLSFVTDDMKRGVERLGVQGFKLYPCYHQYELCEGVLDPVMSYARKVDLPVFVQLRMEDYRSDYIVMQKQVDTKDLGIWLDRYYENRIMLLTVRANEVTALSERIKGNDRIAFDMSGLKDGLFVVEKLIEAVGCESMAYGSLFPLFCLKSTLALLEYAQTDEQTKQDIFSMNVERWLSTAKKEK